jgi:hypothetical protein
VELPLRFIGTTTADLQTTHDAIVSYMKTGMFPSGTGIESYAIDLRQVKRWSLKETAWLVNEISRELKRRTLPTEDEIGLVEFDDPSSRSTVNPTWQPFVN